jgi:hypothetical protein
MDTVPSGTQELAGSVRRVSDRLRSLSDVRLARPVTPTPQPVEAAQEPSRADAAHALAQLMADRAAQLEGIPARTVPRLHDLAVGDQVAVTGGDLVSAVTAGTGTAAARTQEVLREATAACQDLLATL